MHQRFSSEFFAGNRQKLRQLFTGTAPIVITANGLLQRGGDSSYAFAQDASFWYLTGVEEPDVTLVMDHGKEYLIVPTRSASRQAFDGEVGAEQLSHGSGIPTVYDERQGWEQLANRLKKVKHVATLAMPPAYLERHGLYTNPARASLVSRLKSYNSNLELLDIAPHLTRLRMVKQPLELATIMDAIDITVAAIKEATRPARLRAYAYEYQVEAELSRGFRRRGALGHGFEPIVASGERACILHNVSNQGRLASNELLLLDVGAQVNHYSADISRVVTLGQISRRQRAVHLAVQEVQDYALSLLKPTVLLHDYEQAVEHFMGEKLRELGLIKTITHDHVRQFYPHSTSHFLGLNVHDSGDYDRPLEPGVVLTVEPGIYINNEGLGVRLEDDILITPRGAKVLSHKLPREL